MLNDASGFRRIYLATGYTDLRRGMEGLASIIKFNFQLDPYQKDILFLFCGRRTDRIKGLVWEGDGLRFLSLSNPLITNSPCIHCPAVQPVLSAYLDKDVRRYSM